MRVADAAGGPGEPALSGGAALTETACDLPRPPRAVWWLGALGAVALHAGCAALAVEYLKPDDAVEELGAPAIEVGLDLLAPHRDASDLPPGPDSEASIASAAVPEHRTEVEETELPKAVPTETEDPEREVTARNPDRPERDARTATLQTEASTPSVAASATAVPSRDNATVAPRSAAPELGNGDALRRVQTTWQKELAAHLDRYQRYPENRSGRSPEIVISFVLDRTGRVMAASIAKSSGDSAFDKAALTTIRRADPVPAPPPSLVAGDTLTVSMPVHFLPPAVLPGSRNARQ